MEAKVDVRKLQMLNDRIIQTLEALTQVRASVHGIGQNGPLPYQQSPYQQSPYQQSPYQQSPFQQSQYPHGVYPQSGPYSAYGQSGAQAGWGQTTLGHSPALSPYAPFAASPFNGAYGLPMGLSHSSHAQGFVPGIAPWHSVPQMSPYSYGQTQQWSPFAPMGLSHTGSDEVERRIVEQRAGDVGRLMQTFPYGAYV